MESSIVTTKDRQDYAVYTASAPSVYARMEIRGGSSQNAYIFFTNPTADTKDNWKVEFSDLKEMILFNSVLTALINEAVEDGQVP
jgi:hypothetical protein